MLRVLMAVGSFPAISETFITQEALSLAQRGASVWSLTRLPIDDKNTSESVQKLIKQTDYAVFSIKEFLGLKPWNHVALLLRGFWLLKSVYPLKTILSRLYAFLRLKKAAESQRINLVHAHWRGASDTAYLLYVLCGVPFTFFVHAHDLYDEGLGKDAAYRALFAKKIAAAQRVFTCTAHNEKTLKQHFPEAAIRLSYHGVSASILKIGEERQYSDGKKTIQLLSVGRLIAYKGFQDMAPLALKLRAAGVDFRWTVIGSGSLESALRIDIAANGLESHIQLKGALPHASVLEAMRQSDIFVFLGKPEQGQYGLPNVLIEAAAAGLALVTTPQPTLTELCTPGESCIAEPLEKLAAPLIALINDPSAIERYGKAAHARANAQHKHAHHTDVLWQECEAVCSL